MTLPGLDLLGAADSDWKIRETIHVFPKGWAFGIFDGPETFGNAAPVIQEVINAAVAGAIRVHAGWNKHGLTPTDALTRRCQRYEKIALGTNIPIYVSPACEYTSNDKIKVMEQLNIVRHFAPHCIPVMSPGNGGWVPPGEIVELHGDTATHGNQIASSDGNALYDLDSKAWVARNKGLIAFGWGFRFNLSEAGPLILPPYKRTAVPGPNYIQSIVRLFDNDPPPPTTTINFRPIKNPLLYKTHAEDMPKNNSRDNLPLLMLQEHATAIEVVTFEGHSLGHFPYFDKYPGGRFRYYAGWPGGMNMYGWQIADLAIKRSGSPYIGFKIGPHYYGLVHAARRQGFF